MQFRRTLSTGGLLALLALALSGCIHATVGMNINADGSGTFQLTTGLTKQITALGITEAQINQSFDQAGQKQVQQYGGTYRVFDDGSYINEEWDHGFKNITELNTLIQESMQSSAGATGGGSTGLSSDNTVKVTQQGSNFHVTGLLDFTSAGAGSSSVPSQAAALLQDAYVRVAVTMPSIIAHNNDAVISGNTATITAKYGEKKTIDVTGGPPGALGGSPLLWIIIALVVLAAIGAGAYFFLRNRSAQAVPVVAGTSQQPASGAFGGFPQTPSAPLAKLHTRAEHMAQELVNRIDERLGDHPPPAMPPDVPPDAPPTLG